MIIAIQNNKNDTNDDNNDATNDNVYNDTATSTTTTTTTTTTTATTTTTTDNDNDNSNNNYDNSNDNTNHANHAPPSGRILPPQPLGFAEAWEAYYIMYIYIYTHFFFQHAQTNDLMHKSFS